MSLEPPYFLSKASRNVHCGARSISAARRTLCCCYRYSNMTMPYETFFFVFFSETCMSPVSSCLGIDPIISTDNNLFDCFELFESRWKHAHRMQNAIDPHATRHSRRSNTRCLDISFLAGACRIERISVLAGCDKSSKIYLRPRVAHLFLRGFHCQLLQP